MADFVAALSPISFLYLIFAWRPCQSISIEKVTLPGGEFLSWFVQNSNEAASQVRCRLVFIPICQSNLI